MKTTKQVIFITMIILGIYDFGVFTFNGEVTTISQVMTDYLRVSTLGLVVISMILGHWLWSMRSKVDTTRLKAAWDSYKEQAVVTKNNGVALGELNDAIDEIVNAPVGPLRYFKGRKLGNIWLGNQK